MRDTFSDLKYFHKHVRCSEYIQNPHSNSITEIQHSNIHKRQVNTYSAWPTIYSLNHYNGERLQTTNTKRISEMFLLYKKCNYRSYVRSLVMTIVDIGHKPYNYIFYIKETFLKYASYSWFVTIRHYNGSMNI